MDTLLMLGVFSIILSSSSCNKKVDYAQSAEFYFVNQTTGQINLDYTNNKFSIEPDKAYVLKQTEIGAQYPVPENYREPISQLINRVGADVLVKIGDKCFLSTDNSEHSIFNIKSYVPEKIDAHAYKFTYIFTEVDYEKAVTCP